MESIFITYNPSSDIGQGTAFRMQTIAGLHGLKIELPARNANSSLISTETKRRIESAVAVLIFIAENVSEKVNAEILHAQKKKKPIIVISENNIKINKGSYPNIELFRFNKHNPDQTLHDVVMFIKNVHTLGSNNTPTKKKQISKEASGIITAVLGIGLGMLALYSLKRD
jgi:hypothetical protein